MRGSISVVDGDGTPITFEDRVGIYRLEDGTHRIVVKSNDDEQPLGLADVTVSRKQDTGPPIELRPTATGIEVHNHRNHNPVHVVSVVSGRNREIDAGAVTTIDRDTVLELGHHTRIRVSLEPDGPEQAGESELAAVESEQSDAKPTTPDDITSETTILADQEKRSQVAIESAEELVADCLPGGPAATALAEAREKHNEASYERAIERANQVRELAANELDLLETVTQTDVTDPSELGALREQSTQFDLDPEVVTVYEQLPEPTGAGSIQGDHPPETIPAAPDFALTYDDIEKGARIGSGGSADVFEATVSTAEGDHDIALKEPRFDTAGQATGADFDHEALTWERLDDHDNIVGVIDWDTDPHPWIAMEYMDLGPLTGVAGRLSPRQAIWTLLGIVNGVYHAHRYGVAHLDLKPGNVLLCSTGQGTWPIPKVADWGLAKVLLERTRDFEGYTPLYAAPEQVDPDSFGSTDTQTDIYQLGAVGYVLVTGQTPFTGGAAEVVHQILESEVTPPTEHAPGLPHELDQIVQTALEKDKDARYESIVYLRDDLQEVYESL